MRRCWYSSARGLTATCCDSTRILLLGIVIDQLLRDLSACDYTADDEVGGSHSPTIELFGWRLGGSSDLSPFHQVLYSSTVAPSENLGHMSHHRKSPNRFEMPVVGLDGCWVYPSARRYSSTMKE